MAACQCRPQTNHPTHPFHYHEVEQSYGHECGHLCVRAAFNILAKKYVNWKGDGRWSNTTKYLPYLPYLGFQ